MRSSRVSEVSVETLESMVLMSAGIFGTEADDVLETDEAGQYLSGLGGDDILTGAARENDLYGGDGNDTLSTNAGGNNLYGGEGQDTVVYAEDRADFDIWLREDGRVMVKDSKRLDAIDGVERFQFGSDVFSMEELFDSSNSAPELLTSQHVSVATGNSLVADLSASDDDGDTVAFSLAELGDSNLFLIDDDGNLKFRDAPDINHVQDQNGDNVYDVYLLVTDGKTTVRKEIWVSVVPDDGTGGGDNSAPEFINLPEGNVFEVQEFYGREPSTFVGQLNVIDVNSDDIVVQIEDVAGSDGNLFSVSDPGGNFTGQLSFTGGYSENRIDFESPQDVNRDNDYQIFVTASDGQASVTQEFTVRVTDVQTTPPVFVGLDEGDLLGSQFASQTPYITAVDPDGRFIRYSLEGPDADLWFISRFDEYSARLIYTGPLSGGPADDNQDGISELTLVASDGEDVSRLNVLLETGSAVPGQPPVFQGLSTGDRITVVDGLRPVTEISAEAPDGGPVYFSLPSSVRGPDNTLFEFDNSGDPILDSQGRLSFRSTPDADLPADANGDGIYEIVVFALSGGAVQDVELQIEVSSFRDGENSAPEFVNLPFTDVSDPIRVSERNEIIADLDAIDPDGDAISFELVEPATRFDIDPSTGVLSWSPVAYQTSASFFGIGPGADRSTQVTVRVTDGDQFTDVVVPIRVVNFDEPSNVAPELTNISDGAIISITELQQFVLDVDAADEDSSQELRYVLSGADAHLFSLNRETGALSTAAQLTTTNPLDRDADNQYELTVSVYDKLAFSSADFSVEVVTAAI